MSEDHVVSIDNQNSLAQATWHIWVVQAAPRKLPISEINFIRMWKTLILRHVQDVYEREKRRRTDHAVSIRGPMHIPILLEDLLSALGSYYAEQEATHHCVVPPTRPADLPPDSWWNLDDQIMREWSLTNTLMKQFGLVKEHVFGAYHPAKDYTNRPLMLTSRKSDEFGNVLIRTRLVGPRPEDGYIRAINDELFEDPFPFEDCYISMTRQPVIAESERYCYVTNSGEYFLENFRCVERFQPPKDHVIAIDAQNGLASATWHYWRVLTFSEEIPISEANFTRMWKTLLLKHIQNIYFQEKHLESDHCIPIRGELLIPYPLQDLLNALGWYEDPHSGQLHHIVPPTRPDNDSDRQDWWDVDWDILDQWIRCNHQISSVQNNLVHKYIFDRDAKHDGRPLMLTARECDQSGNVTIRARLSGPRPEDALIRIVNDELFEEPYPVQDCHLILNGPVGANSVMREYLERERK